MSQFFAKQPLKNIIAVFLLPIILSTLLYLLSGYINIKNTQQNMNIQFSEKLSEFTQLNKETTNNIFQDLPNVTSFASVKDILYKTSYVNPYDSVTMDAQSILTLYKQNNPMIDNVCLVNKAAHFVVTESSVYSFNEFFETYYKYNDYDINYWKELRISSNRPKLLEASEVYHEDNVTETKIIIPYVCAISNSQEISSYIIVNLDLGYVYNTLKSYSYSPNSKVFLMNNNTHRCLSSSGLVDFPFENEELKDSFLKKNFSTYSSVSMGKNDYYVMVASSANSLYNFSYIVCVPNIDITSNIFTEKTSFLLMLLIEIAIFAIALLIFISKVYKPLNYINQLTTRKNSSDSDVLKHIIEYIHTSSYNISSLEGKIDELLPYGTQNYLCNILKGNGKQDTAFEEIAFKYAYYLLISVEIIFNHKFYEDIDMPYLSAQTIDIINTQFEMNHQIYCISKSATTLTILINLQDESGKDDVNETIASIYKLFVADSMYISIYFGVGPLISDLSQLAASFGECKRQIHSELAAQKQNTSPSTSIFGHNENMQLNNYLTNGNITAVIELLDNVNAQLLSAPRDIIASVYSDIIFTLYRIMKSKGITPSVNGKTQDTTHIFEICSKPQNEIYEYVLQYIEQIDEAFNMSGTKFDIDAIVHYIQAHFTEDLSLDFLSDKYGTYPQYLSKRIKQYLGLTYHDYVSSLRVEKAKELLVTTDLGITEICEKSGFISRNTFLRVFKKHVGIPPSDYRKKHQNSEKTI